MARGDNGEEDSGSSVQPLPRPKRKKAEAAKRELKSPKRQGGVPVLQKPKKKSKKWWWIGGFLIVALITAAFFVPRIGTSRYGICKIYIEMHDPYPDFLEFMQAEERGYLVIIDYNRVDSFGQRTLNQMRCSFKSEGNTNQLVSVDLNGRTNVYGLEAPEMIAKFNVGIPAILKNKPSLIMPKGFPEDIQDFK